MQAGQKKSAFFWDRPPGTLEKEVGRFSRNVHRDATAHRRTHTTIMKTTGNTILITGGGTGIGRGLAEAFHARGNRVIISGRRQKALDATTVDNPGMQSLTVDMADPASIRSFADKLAGDYPALNVLINNAGMMHVENLLTPSTDSAEAKAHVVTNLLGPIRLTAALLPLLLKQEHAAVMMVSSVLGFVPWAATPTYCATKAAIHSYAQSLRYQLKDTVVEVLELIPPYVATTLMGEQMARDPLAMPADEFIAEVMDILQTQPNATEVCVGRAQSLRHAADGGRDKYEQAFGGLNAAWKAH